MKGSRDYISYSTIIVLPCMITQHKVNHQHTKCIKVSFENDNINFKGLGQVLFSSVLKLLLLGTSKLFILGE